MRTAFSKRSRRGQAAVELSLLGIILVPIILYVLFLDDLLRFKQDQQEAMVTTGWDFSIINFDPATKKGTPYIGRGTNQIWFTVMHYNRYAFGDHTMAEPAFQDETNQKEHHHLGVGAHQCWIVGSENNQITCTQVDRNAATGYLPDLTSNAQSALASNLLTPLSGAGDTGGFYSCKGKVGVINHWLPSGTLFFSKEELSSRKYHGVNSADAIGYNGSNVHNISAAAGNNSKTDSYHFPVDTYGILTNPFAMADQDEILAGTHSGPLYDRVDSIYNANLVQLAPIAATAFAAVLSADYLINPIVALDGTGDLVNTPEVAFRNVYDPKLSSGTQFYTSQFYDWSGNDVQQTYTSRGNWYLGSKNKP